MERRKLRLGVVATFATTSLLWCGTTSTSAQPPETRVASRVAPADDGERPNIMVVTVDDMSPDDLQHLRRVDKLLAEEGTTMTNAVATTPVCVPARASLLSGQFTHNHQARTVGRVVEPGGWASFDDRNTLPVWLGRAGYDTMFVGKYLNGYGVDSSPRYVPRGWTEWRGSVDPWTYRYRHPRLNVDGRLRDYRSEYSTEVFAKHANRLLKKDRRTRRPWFLWVNHVTPHNGGPIEDDDPKSTHPGHRPKLGTPSPLRRDRDDFADTPMPAKPNLFEDTSDKAFPVAQRPPEPAWYQDLVTEVWQQRLEALKAVDRKVAGHLRVLERSGQLENTLVVFMSDNGYLMGEHNVVGKAWHYRESLEVPMVLRGPGVPAGAQADTLISIADLPVTLASLAGAYPGRVVDGADVSTYWEQPSDAQRAAPISLFRRTGDGYVDEVYRGVRVADWYTYARSVAGAEELFDLRADPYELTNVVDDPAYADVVEQLRELTDRWADCQAEECPQGEVTLLPDGTIDLGPGSGYGTG